MLSIKRFLEHDGSSGKTDPPRTSEALFRFASLLLQGLILHVVEYDPTETDWFRTRIQALAVKLEGEPTPAEILFIAGAVVTALREYNCRVTKLTSQHGFEYHAMIGMLTETVSGLAKGSDETVSQLHILEKQLERVAVIEDIRQVRSELSVCLAGLRSEGARQKEHSASAISEIKLQLGESQNRLRSLQKNNEIDRCTGLPMRAAAEQDIMKGMRGDQKLYVVIIVIGRVQLAKLRYGSSVGDSLVLAFLQQLVKKLPKSDRCYRWTDAALLVLLERTNEMTSVQSEIQRFVPHTIEKTFEIGNKSVLMHITSDWSVIPALHGSDVIRKIDTFVLAKSGDPSSA